MTTLTSRAMLIALSMLLAVMLIWSALLYQSNDHSTLSNYLFNVGYSLLYLGGGLGALAAYLALGQQGLIARAFLFLALSLFSYTGGQLTWSYYNLFGETDVPYPSLADVFFVLFIPFTTLAISMFLKVYQILITKRVVIESIIVFLASTTLIFFLEGAGGFKEGVPVLESIFDVLYPLTDAILITLALIVIRSSAGALHSNLVLLVIGYLVGAAADFTFSYRTAAESYWNGDLTDALFTLSAFIMAIATVRLAREFVSIREAHP